MRMIKNYGTYLSTDFLNIDIRIRKKISRGYKLVPGILG
jgi:hypothetical protein